MTVKELEQITGINRARILFYEREGLLHPTHARHGRRRYTEQDIDTLHKIRLLRALQLSTDEIRTIQQGTYSLSAALHRQAGRRFTSEAIRSLCQDIAAGQEDYASLDAMLWLRILDERENGAESGGLARAPYPWRRTFARFLDLSLCAAIWIAVRLYVLHWYRDTTVLTLLLDSYICWALLLLLEPPFLAFTGTTPGKWLLGLWLRDPHGNRLSLHAAWMRTIQIFLHGVYGNLPIVSLIGLARTWHRLQRGSVPMWDEGCSYHSRPLRPGRTVVSLFCQCAIVVLCVLLLQFAALPPNRGALTTREFSENVNYLIQYHNLQLPYLLDANAVWRKNDAVAYFFDANDPDIPPSYELTTDENGHVQTVSFHLGPFADGEVHSSEETLRTLAWIALSGAHVLHPDASPMALPAEVDEPMHLVREQGNLRAELTVKLAGYLYYTPEADLFIPDEEAPAHFLELTCTISLL